MMKRATAALILTLAISGMAHAQAWSGIIDPSRAIDWSTAGVSGGIPARTTICSTLSAGASLASINSAIAACPSGQTVLLNAGTYNLAGGIIWNNKSNVTLRGAGANQTLLVFTSSGNCQGQGASLCMTSSDQNYYQTPSNTANWTAGYAIGTTVITLSSTTNLHVGNPLILDELDDTASAPPPSTGIYICETNAGDCALDGPSGTSRTGRAQLQIVTVTNISGSNVTISPPIYMPNWASGKSPGAWWATSPVLADGVENLSIDSSGSSNQSSVEMFNCSGCWVSGIRSSTPARSHVWMWNSPRATVQNSYFYGTQSAATESYGLEPFPSSDSLYVNNIFQKIAAPQTINGPCPGCVIAYNYSINNYYTPSSNWQQQSAIDHSVTSFLLFEGNVGAGYYGDSFHGTHHFNTLFRNRYDGFESNNGTTTSEQTNPMILYPLSRYYNILGNVLGTSGYHVTYQETTNVTGHELDIYILGTQSSGGGYPDDAFTSTSLFRWGNYDTVNAANRFVSSEVPSSLSPYGNAVPASTNLPASFYYPSTPSWWPSTKAWPPIGPDVTGGNITNVGGHAYTIPAQDCFINVMGGPANGVGSLLAFNASSCYSSTPPPPAPIVTFSPTTLSFGNQLISTSSAAQNVTLTNTGTATLNISSIAIAGTNASSFSQTNTCGSTLAATNSCTISVTFTPLLIGSKIATVSVSDNAAGTPQTVPLSGTGISSTPGIPTLVQHTQGSNTLSSSSGPSWIGGPNNTYTTYLPNPTQSGNCIIVGMRFDNTQTPTITVSDDKGNTYSVGNVTVDSGNTNKFAIYYALNVAAGTRKINVLLSSSTAATEFAVLASEFYNVATVGALDGNSGAVGTSATMAAGSVTPSSSGDLVYQIATQGTGSLVTYTAGSQSNITWSLLSADTQKPFGAQYGVYNSTAALNPTFTQSSAVNFETAAIFLQPATAGSAASAGLTVNRISHNSLWSSGTGGPGFSTSQNLQFPSVGPLLIAATTTGGGSLNDDVTSITDNNGNTWLQCGPGLSASNHTAHLYYTASAVTGSGEVVTVHSINNTGDSTVMLYDISGASSTPCDTNGSANGDQTTAVSSLIGPTVTPTTINGIVIGVIQQYNGTVISLANSAILNDAELYSQENLNGPENVDQNGGYAHYYNPTTSSVNFTWNYQLDGSNTPQDYWTSYAAAFKSATVSPAVSFSPTSVTFPGTVVANSSTPIAITLTNTGTATLSITSITITGANPGDYSQTNTCPSNLAATNNCTISATFKPTATGSRAAAVSVTDNASGSPQTVPLTGVGTNPTPPPTPHRPIIMGSLPAGTVGTAYSAALTATGDTPPLSWSASPTVPGLSLAATTGVLSGSPTTAGVFTPTFTLQDSYVCGPSDPIGCSNTSAPYPASLTIATTPPSKYVINATPASLTFTGTVGASIACQTTLINDTTPLALPVAITSSVSWLTVAPAKGNTKLTITVCPAATGLAAGTYTGSAIVTATLPNNGYTVNNSPFSLPVTLTLTGAPPPPLTITCTSTVNPPTCTVNGLASGQSAPVQLNPPTGPTATAKRP